MHERESVEKCRIVIPLFSPTHKAKQLILFWSHPRGDRTGDPLITTQWAIWSVDRDQPMRKIRMPQSLTRRSFYAAVCRLRGETVADGFRGPAGVGRGSECSSRLGAGTAATLVAVRLPARRAMRQE